MIKYSYDSIVHSEKFADNYWAVRAALDKDKKYTLKEAQETVQKFLKRKVK